MDRADPNWSQWRPWEEIHHKGRRILKECVIVNAKFQVLGLWGSMLVLSIMCSSWCWKPFQSSTLVLGMWLGGISCVKLWGSSAYIFEKENLKSCGAKKSGSLALALRPRLCRGITPRSKGFSFSFGHISGNYPRLVEIVIFLGTYVYGVVPTWVGYPQHSLSYHYLSGTLLSGWSQQWQVISGTDLWIHITIPDTMKNIQGGWHL